MRPNKATLKFLSKYRTLHFDNRQYISVYARKGVKGVEMKIRPFLAYTNAVDFLWKHTSNFFHEKKGTDMSTYIFKKKPVIFFGTEDPNTLREAVTWGKQENLEVRSSFIYKHVFRYITM
jgi:hypothetical protein